MRKPIDVNSTSSIFSAIALGTLGVLSFIIQPALVQGYVTVLSVSEPTALNLAGIEMLGVAISAIALALPGVTLDWGKLVAPAIGLAIAGNALSALLLGGSGIWIARLLAGLGHGAIISLSFSFVGLTRNVERNIALYLTSLLTYGAFGIWLLPSFLDRFGLEGLFFFFCILLLMGLATVTHVPHAVHARMEVPQSARDLPRGQVLIALLGVLSYNLAQGIAWAVLFLVGINAGLSEQPVADDLFVSQVLAIFGALASVFLAGTIARGYALAVGILGGAACIALLLEPPTALVFLISVCGFNFLWNFVLPFILAAVGEFDTKGSMVGKAVAMQMLGLGSGPFIAGWLTDGSSYFLVELACIAFFLASFMLLFVPMRHQKRMLESSRQASSS